MCHSHVSQAIRLQIVKTSELEAFLPSIFPGFVAFLQVFFQLLLYWFCTFHRLLCHLALLTSNVQRTQSKTEFQLLWLQSWKSKLEKCRQRNLQFKNHWLKAKCLERLAFPFPFILLISLRRLQGQSSQRIRKEQFCRFRCFMLTKRDSWPTEHSHRFQLILCKEWTANTATAVLAAGTIHGSLTIQDSLQFDCCL